MSEMQTAAEGDVRCCSNGGHSRVRLAEKRWPVWFVREVPLVDIT